MSALTISLLSSFAPFIRGSSSTFLKRFLLNDTPSVFYCWYTPFVNLLAFANSCTFHAQNTYLVSHGTTCSIELIKSNPLYLLKLFPFLLQRNFIIPKVLSSISCLFHITPYLETHRCRDLLYSISNLPLDRLAFYYNLPSYLRSAQLTDAQSYGASCCIHGVNLFKICFIARNTRVKGFDRLLSILGFLETLSCDFSITIFIPHKGRGFFPFLETQPIEWFYFPT